MSNNTDSCTFSLRTNEYTAYESFRLLSIYLIHHYFAVAREDYWTELLIWLLIWVPLDLRWYYKDYFYGAGFMAYDWWALVG